MIARLSATVVAVLTCALLEAGAGSNGLFVVPGAVDVVRDSTKGEASVIYYVKEAYPAEATLAFIERRLSETGWRPVLGKDLDRYEASSLDSGWNDVPGQRVPIGGRIWSARWVDGRGNEVVYSLSYTSLQAENGMTPTHVAVAAWQRDKAAGAEFRRRMREEVDRIPVVPDH